MRYPFPSLSLSSLRFRLDLTGSPLSLQNAPQPVKRRRALLASNPLRNSRLKLIAAVLGARDSSRYRRSI